MARGKEKRFDIAQAFLRIAETSLTDEQESALMNYQTWAGNKGDVFIQFPFNEYERDEWASNLTGFPASTDPVFASHVPRDKILRATRNPLSSYESASYPNRSLDRLANGIVDYFGTNWRMRNE